jgi:eukaryotic-like serine/threonine-protein kinase
MNERAIFLAALAKDPAERAAFVEQACGSDRVLRQSVETLLRLDREDHRFLDVSVVEQLAGVEPALDRVDDDLSFLAPSSEPGSQGRIDNFEVLEVVGRGGTGIVLRARDTKLLRVVALKVLAAPLAASGSARQRFVREARAAAAVRDDHVVAIHAVSDDAPMPYLAMEFIDGQSLDAVIRRSGPLGVKEVLRIGIQVATGLAAAHKQGLIHRDVKPANILLENGVQRVKLTDFGLARAAADASVTQSGFTAGTPLYMAPEQATGEPLSPRTDLFSLGSVLYEMCTGRPAFRAPNTVAVLRRVCDDTPRPIRELNPDIPEPLCRVIESLQSKKPVDRPSSAMKVVELLTQLLVELNQSQSRPLSVAPPGQSHDRPANTADRPTPLSRPWIWGAASLALLIVGGSVSEATGVTDMGRTVIRLFSPEGTLVIDVQEPGVSVAVDGADLAITGAGVNEIRLKPGQYNVKASRDGKFVSRELVTVIRNGRQLVRIRKEAAPSTDAEKWEKSAAGLPAEEQVKAFVLRMKELNSGYDGKVTPTVLNGVVTKLDFHTDLVNDLSPVRAFRGLQSLDCWGPLSGSGPLSDLAPLRGLALKGMQCPGSLVSDLGPLRGMPLTLLHCGHTRVTNLSPLKGMKLEVLMVQSTGVSDLTPLQGMPLNWLDLAWAVGVSDLSPVRGMPLEYLNLTALPLSDLSLLADMKTLRWLVLDDMAVTDLTPLRGLRLRKLSLRRIRATDLSPLKGMPLRELRLDYGADREEFVRSFTGIELINDKPAAEFWKDIGGK